MPPCRRLSLYPTRIFFGVEREDFPSSVSERGRLLRALDRSDLCRPRAVCARAPMAGSAYRMEHVIAPSSALQVPFGVQRNQVVPRLFVLIREGVFCFFARINCRILRCRASPSARSRSLHRRLLCALTPCLRQFLLRKIARINCRIPFFWNLTLCP